MSDTQRKSGRKSARWPMRDQELIELVAQGWVAKQCAGIMDIPVNAIWERAVVLELLFSNKSERPSKFGGDKYGVSRVKPGKSLVIPNMRRNRGQALVAYWNDRLEGRPLRGKTLANSFMVERVSP